MSANVTCEACGASLPTGDLPAAKTTNCPKCGRAITIAGKGTKPVARAKRIVQPNAAQPQPGLPPPGYDPAYYGQPPGGQSYCPQPPYGYASPQPYYQAYPQQQPYPPQQAYPQQSPPQQPAAVPVIPIAQPEVAAITKDTAAAAEAPAVAPSFSFRRMLVLGAFAVALVGAGIGISLWIVGDNSAKKTAREPSSSPSPATAVSAVPEATVPKNVDAPAYSPIESSRQADAAATKLRAALEAAEAIDWQVTTPENKNTISAAVAQVADARSIGGAADALDDLERRLSARAWHFAPHVEPLNAHVVDTLTNGRNTPVMFFGRVMSLSNSDPKEFVVQLAGRGYELKVVDLFDPPTPHKLDDEVVVLGLRVQPADMVDVPAVFAALVVEAEWSDVPEDVALRRCADYFIRQQRLDELRRLLVERYDKFWTIELNPKSSLSRVRHKIPLNGRGYLFDAVQLPASAVGPDDDLVLYFAAPEQAIDDWGIVSGDGAVGADQVKSYEFTNYTPPGSTWPAEYRCRVQVIAGARLLNSRKHLIWFKCRDAEPIELHIGGYYVRKGALTGDSASLLTQLGFSPAPPSETRAFTQSEFASTTVSPAVVAVRVVPSTPQISVSNMPVPPPVAAPATSIPTPNAQAGPASTAGPVGPPKITTLFSLPTPQSVNNRRKNSVTVPKLSLTRMPRLEFSFAGAAPKGNIDQFFVRMMTVSSESDVSYALVARSKTGAENQVGNLWIENKQLRFTWSENVTPEEAAALRTAKMRGVGKDIVVFEVTFR